ncbi:MAG: type II toxin-antitoxin system RelE/ParE family toxin [Pseudomonadota bacterium]
MEIRNAAHKGLKLLLTKDDDKKLPAEYAERIRSLLALFLAMEDISEFFKIPRGNPHVLRGARKGVHAISVYANWRLTFRHDTETNEIYDLDFEDYHRG